MTRQPGSLRASGTPEAQDEAAFAVHRRAALKLLASGAALALASCGHPDEQVVPYVEIPDGVTPGIRMAFASAVALAGYARGVIVTTVEGRPIKIEGNPRHPASLGATDIFADAAMLSLYDPDRSKAPRTGGGLRSWTAFERELQAQIARVRAGKGAGLRILTNRVTSPTLLGQLDGVLKSLPEAKWYRYEPVDDDAERAGALQAFGRPLTALPRLRDARVLLALDADPIGFGPEQIRLSREFAAARQASSAADFLRLYVVEPAFTLSGANADHRLPLDHALIRNMALAVAAGLNSAIRTPPLPDAAERFARAVAADLKSRAGQAMVIAGRRQSAEVHALCHWINQTLHAPIDFIAPIDPTAAGHGNSLRALAGEIAEGKVQTLIILADNPVFDAPGELKLGEAIASVPFSAHLALYDNETSAHCNWHLPLSHALESWSDLRAFDGTASVVQPLIRPLYDSRTAHQLLAFLDGAGATSSYDLVRSYWQSETGTRDFNSWWRQTLEDGLIGDSAAKKVSTGDVNLPKVAPSQTRGTLSLVLAPDPSIWDGSVANNAWLQECPKPLTIPFEGEGLKLRFEMYVASSKGGPSMKVKEAMHKGVDWVSPDTPVPELARLMRDRDVGAIPIGENDRLVTGKAMLLSDRTLRAARRRFP